MAGNLKFGIVKDGESKWIKDAEQIKSDLKNHVLTYRIADPLLNKGEITFKAISLKNTNGILIEVSANRLPENVHLFYTFGGAYGKVLSDDKPYALLPRYCKDNVFNVERTSFTLYYGESGNLKVLQGILPLTAEIRISDANRQTSPLALHNSGKTDAPVLSAIIPLENNKKSIFAFTGKTLRQIIIILCYLNFLKKNQKEHNENKILNSNHIIIIRYSRLIGIVL